MHIDLATHVDFEELAWDRCDKTMINDIKNERLMKVFETPGKNMRLEVKGK